MKKMRKSGFTLVEILIVVIILGILATIIIPQFTDASTGARESSLRSNLQVLRSQVGLYKIQHNDTYPDTTDAASFVGALTNATLVDGTVDAAGEFGPYMQTIPQNPFASSDGTVVANLVDIDGTVGDDDAHWHFDSATGAITPDDGQLDPDGNSHDDL